MSDDSESLVSVDELSDDPLRMPPPYWRSSGGIFQVQVSVYQIANKLLPDLAPANEAFQAVTALIDPEDDPADPDSPYNRKEIGILINLENEITRLGDLAIFMAAIEAEDAINKFAVFNVHKDAAEAIEKLSPPDKLILVTALVGATPVKGTAPFEAIRRLTAWRNAAAHGHCVDRPTSSLRKNHLIGPREFPNVAVKIGELQARLGDYFRVKEYLRSISLNDYTSERNEIDPEIANALAVIGRYRFQDVDGAAYEVLPPGDQTD